MTQAPIFITGNENKAKYMAQIIGVPLAHQKFDLIEIQAADVVDVVRHKVIEAYEKVKAPVIVEDVGVQFNALGAMPGPFIKFFLEQPNGAELLCRMIDGFDDRSAVAVCVFGYYDGERLDILQGSHPGVIAENPRGTGGYGWDMVFCPDGAGGRSNAELSPNEYEDFQKLIKPYQALRDLLTSL